MSLPFSLALSTPFPSGKGCLVLVSSRLLSVQVNWNFSPILCRNVGKTSSINPHIRTVYNIKTISVPESISGESPDALSAS